MSFEEMNFATGEITYWDTAEVSRFAREFSYPSVPKKEFLVQLFSWIDAIYQVTELSLMTVLYQILSDSNDRSDKSVTF